MSEPIEQDGEIAPESQKQLYQALAASAVALIAAGTLLFRWLEDWSWVDSFYFSVVAATTVGFGDLAPESDAGKLVTVGYIVIGISIIATFLDARFKRAAARRAERHERRPRPS